MAFAASDGKRFTNKPPMMAHERSMKRMGGMSDRTDPLGQPAGGMDEESGEDVAREHGPAVEVNVMHNHEAGEHHVHSVHEDGHEHHSDHASAEEAHDHAKSLASADDDDADDEGDDDENPEFE